MEAADAAKQQRIDLKINNTHIYYLCMRTFGTLNLFLKELSI